MQVGWFSTIAPRTPNDLKVKINSKVLGDHAPKVIKVVARVMCFAVEIQFNFTAESRTF